MPTIESYATLSPVPVTNVDKVGKLLKRLVSDAEIHIKRYVTPEGSFFSFWAESSVHWEDGEGPISEFLERLRPCIKGDAKAVYKEAVVTRTEDDLKLEAFAWYVTRDRIEWSDLNE